MNMYSIVHTGGKSHVGGAILGIIQPLAFKSPANHTAPLAATKVEAYNKSQVSMLIYFFKDFIYVVLFKRFRVLDKEVHKF